MRTADMLIISLLKQSLEMQLSQSQSSLQQLQHQFSQEREHLRMQLDELQTEHQRRQQRLQEVHRCSVQDMEHARKRDLKELEERLRHHHHAELQSLREAHRHSIETLKQQSEQELQTLRFELEDEGKAMLGQISSLQATQMTQEAAIRDVDNERSRLKDKVLRMEEERESLQSQSQALDERQKQQLQSLEKVCGGAAAHEQELTKRHERELAEMNAIHSRETQNMLSDFNKAQEVLKDKISALQILLEGTEDKFRNRESRHEDLQVIAELRDMVSERESLVKKLVVGNAAGRSATCFELSTDWMETNFNKVFNASPNVGVINPLIKVGPAVL
ncbi:Protein FAM184A [Liparis tanakae]|uniref:Protein FAM184A n=1 Tax=Liparis tanakae TaxID=230148 RepID=A0A4Z2GR28_9TELE|nr:Protein FAM184A [Liparis tanakae]